MNNNKILIGLIALTVGFILGWMISPKIPVGGDVYNRLITFTDGIKVESVTNDIVTNLKSTEDFMVQDAGTTFFTLDDAGKTTIGSGGTAISKHNSVIVAVAFDLDTVDTVTLATAAVSGAAIGDTVSVGMHNTAATLGGSTWEAWVSAADVVSVRYYTGSVTTTDATLDVRLDVWKH